MANVKSGGFVRDTVSGVLVVTPLDLNHGGFDDCQTISNLDASFAGDFSAATGIVWGFRAINRKTQTYTKIRVSTGSVGATAITDTRLGVYDAAGTTKLAETANASATITTANIMYEIALLVPLALNAGDITYLTIGQLGTTPATIRGTSLQAQFINELPVSARSFSGWVGGSLPASLNTVQRHVGWLKLVP